MWSEPYRQDSCERKLDGEEVRHQVIFRIYHNTTKGTGLWGTWCLVPANIHS